MNVIDAQFILTVVQIGVGLITMAAVGFMLIRNICITYEARMARAEVLDTARRAEQAANAAAGHARDAVTVLSVLAKNGAPADAPPDGTV